jgi:hypothetical protein
MNKYTILVTHKSNKEKKLLKFLCDNNFIFTLT